MIQKMQQPINIFIVQFRLKTLRQMPFVILLPKKPEINNAEILQTCN